MPCVYGHPGKFGRSAQFLRAGFQVHSSTPVRQIAGVVELTSGLKRFSEKVLRRKSRDASPVLHRVNLDEESSARRRPGTPSRNRFDQPGRVFDVLSVIVTFAILALLDILDFSKIEEGMLELASTRFSLTALIDNSDSIIRGTAINKNLRVEAAIEPGIPPFLVGDDGRLRQILLNLLNNAIKCTRKGHVVLAVQRDGLSEAGPSHPDRFLEFTPVAPRSRRRRGD